jgi:hypothetical protein
MPLDKKGKGLIYERLSKFKIVEKLRARERVGGGRFDVRP